MTRLRTWLSAPFAQVPFGWADVGVIGGFFAVVYGVALLHLPSAIIITGVVALGLAVLKARGE